VFEEILGIPAHPLLVHAAVVFVPLQILAALAYALVPFVRRYIVWFVVGIAVIAPITVFTAKLSGDAFRARKIRIGQASDELLARIDQHSSFGVRTLYASLILSVLMILMLFAQTRSRRGVGSPPGGAETSTPGKGSMVLGIILTVAVLGAGATAGYFVFKTGDSGAKMVWTGS